MTPRGAVRGEGGGFTTEAQKMGLWQCEISEPDPLQYIDSSVSDGYGSRHAPSCVGMYLEVSQNRGVEGQLLRNIPGISSSTYLFHVLWLCDRSIRPIIAIHKGVGTERVKYDGAAAWKHTKQIAACISGPASQARAREEASSAKIGSTPDSQL